MNPRACIVSAIRPARDVRTFHRMARSLARAGWDVTVVGRDPGPPAVADGVNIVPLPAATGMRRGLLQLRALQLALATRADVYQVNDVELLPAALAVLKRRRRAVIYECREDYPAYMLLKPWLPRRLRPLVARSVARVEWLAARRLDAVVTADEATAERLGSYGATVALVHNYPGRSWFKPPPPTAARPHDVLYHGSLPGYHLRTLASIAAALAGRVPEARWLLVGQPDRRDDHAAFDAALARAGIADRVALRPRIPFPDVPALLRQAHAGVIPLQDVPKFQSNVPVKLFEYLASGVAVVASDLLPMRRLLAGTEAAMLVPPDRPDAFADALAGLLRDPERRAALVTRGLAAVQERFHWEREEPTLLRLYDALLCGPGFRSVTQEMMA
jgi:glycosyltransferase involved in cell wall biosynthesis